MSTEQDPLRFFQFLAGERKGEVLVLKNIVEEDGMIFLEFRDNSRCNEELVLPLNDRNYTNQLMAEVSDPNNVWQMKEEWVGREEEKWAENADGKKVCVQEFYPGKLKITPIPPKRVKSNFGQITQSITTPEPSKPDNPAAPEKTVVSGDPVYGMMEAAKKFPTPVEVEISINLPKKSLFDVANESFENGGDKVVEYIIENLDITDLKDALRVALFDAYGATLTEEAKEENIMETPIQEASGPPDIPEVELADVQVTPEVQTKAIEPEQPELPELPESAALYMSYEPEAVEEPVIGPPVAAPNPEK